MRLLLALCALTALDDNLEVSFRNVHGPAVSQAAAISTLVACFLAASCSAFFSAFFSSFAASASSFSCFSSERVPIRDARVPVVSYGMVRDKLTVSPHPLILLLVRLLQMGLALRNARSKFAVLGGERANGTVRGRDGLG